MASVVAFGILMRDAMDGNGSLGKIARKWEVVSGHRMGQELLGEDVLAPTVCCSLGAAGLGKSVELSRLSHHELAAHLDVRRVAASRVRSRRTRAKPLKR
jgi:hypothetical protein